MERILSSVTNLCSTSFPLHEGVAPTAVLTEGVTQAPLIANFCRCISHYQVIEAVMSVAGKRS